MLFSRKNKLKNALIIINPVAGKMRSQKALFHIVDYFCRHDYVLTVQTTRGKNDAKELVLEYATDKDLIVCAGGDGTLNEVISGLMQLNARPAVGYIPTGTTNDFASTLKIPKNIKPALKKIIAGTPFSLDIGKFGADRYFSYIASFGIFTETSYTTPQSVKNLLGHFAYVLEGIREIAALKTHTIAMNCDDQQIEGDFIFGAISNSKSIGGVLKLSDEKVSLSDGLFEILLIRAPKNIAELHSILSSIYTQKFDSPLVQFIQAKSISVTTEGRLAWSLDGESAYSEGKVEVECQHNAISIML